jgi:hypothetical protein
VLLIETIGAGLSGIMFVVTVLWPDWIEAVTGWNPDGGSGALEWGIALAFALSAVTLGLLAHRYRRLEAP